MINSEKIKVITHEELALLWMCGANTEKVIIEGRKKDKYLHLIPKEPEQAYKDRLHKANNVYVAYFESLILKYLGPDAKHKEWTIDQHTGRIKPRV